jgi:hypothetical protein
MTHIYIHITKDKKWNRTTNLRISLLNFNGCDDVCGYREYVLHTVRMLYVSMLLCYLPE